MSYGEWREWLQKMIIRRTQSLFLPSSIEAYDFVSTRHLLLTALMWNCSLLAAGSFVKPSIRHEKIILPRFWDEHPKTTCFFFYENCLVGTYHLKRSSKLLDVAPRCWSLDSTSFWTPYPKVKEMWKMFIRKNLQTKKNQIYIILIFLVKQIFLYILRKYGKTNIYNINPKMLHGDWNIYRLILPYI